MLVGDRFEKDGKQYEVTELLPNGNYAYKLADPLPVEQAPPKEEAKPASKVIKRGGKKV